MNDLDRELLRRGIRVAVLVTAVFGGLQWLTQNPTISLSAAFACFSTLAFANLGGPRRSRFLANVVLGINGVALVTIGSIVVQWPIPTVVVTFGVVFVVAFAAVLRGYFAAATAAAILPWAFAATSEYSPDAIAEHAVGWAIGAAVAAIGSITVLPVYARSATRVSLAAALTAAADACEDLAAGRSTHDSLTRLSEASTRLHSAFDGRLIRPGGATRRDRALLLAVDEATRLLPTLEWAELGPVTLSDSDRELMGALGATLRDCAQALTVGDVVPDVNALDTVRHRHALSLKQFTTDSLLAEQPHVIRPSLERSGQLRLVALSVQAMAIDVSNAMDPINATLRRQRDDQARGPGRITFEGREFDHHSDRITARRLISSQMTWSSPWLRTALRTAVALTATVAIVVIVGAEHGFWVTLGALVALKFDASGTMRTARQVLMGTVAGFAIGLIIVVLPFQAPWLMWLALPILAFLATYTPGAVSLIVGQASFTLFVIFLVSLTTPAKLEVAEWRLLDVLIGLAVSMGVSLLMWPHGVVPLLWRSLRSAVVASTRYSLTSFETLVDGTASVGGLSRSREHALRTTTRAFEAFDLAYAQRGPGLNQAPIMVSGLNVANHLNYSGDVVADLAEIASLPPEFATTGDTMLAAMHRVAMRITTLADRWEAVGDSAPAGTAPYRSTLDRLRAAVDADIQHLTSRVKSGKDPIDDAATAVLVVCLGTVWISQSAWIADTMATKFANRTA